MRTAVCVLLALSVAVPSLQVGDSVSGRSAGSLPTGLAADMTAPSEGDGDVQGAAGKATTPEDLVRTQWAAIVAVLQDQNLDQPAKEEEIERIASPIIDFSLMGKLALGRAHWSKLTPSQRERYLRLFETRVKRSYRGKIALYEGEEILLKFPQAETTGTEEGTTPERTAARKAKSSWTVHIPIELVSKGRRATVLHKFHKVDERWRLYDFEIEGVSFLLTYRAQFNDILRTGTVENLLSRLAEAPPHSPVSS